MSDSKEISAELQTLLHVGKRRGYVTYEEMNNAIPTHLVEAHRLDEVMILFSDNDIEVVKEQRRKAQAGPRREAQQAREDNRSQDPVRVYLRNMGSVSLLSREGEVEIAKRIEQGETVIRRILQTRTPSVQLIEALIAHDEERMARAQKSGKRAKPTRTTDNRSLDEVLVDARAANQARCEARDAVQRARSDKQRRLAEEAHQVTCDHMFEVIGTLDYSKPQIASMSRQVREAWGRDREVREGDRVRGPRCTAPRPGAAPHDPQGAPRPRQRRRGDHPPHRHPRGAVEGLRQPRAP